MQHVWNCEVLSCKIQLIVNQIKNILIFFFLSPTGVLEVEVEAIFAHFIL